jgi:hypothetical protein
LVVDWGRFVDLLALLEVGLGIELFEHVHDSILAGAADYLLRLFGVFCEDADVGRVFLGTSNVLS